VKVNWQQFWETYRRTEMKGEEDLFFAVGKTVNQRPISEASFKLSIELVARDLKLNTSDKLLELCCGNGLMSLPLALLVREVYAVDFAKHLIENARRFRRAPNIRYICAEAGSYITDLAANKSYIPSKILLGDALAYFEPESLGDILASATKLSNNNFIFLATGIPSDELKWNFYNTPERVKRYKENQRLESNTNDGLGRWWHTSELEHLARDCGLNLLVKPQPPELSTFRVDAIFSHNS
jgi:SAM-dependent methyltransferase